MDLLRREVVDLLNIQIYNRLELLECDIVDLFATGVEDKLMSKYNITFNSDKDCFE